MKNKKAFLYGSVFGLITALFASELFQAFLAWLTGKVDYSIFFRFYNISTEIFTDGSVTVFEAAFLYLSPVLFSMGLIELAHYFLKKTPPGTARFSLVIFNLIVSGYLIIKIFYGAFVSILSPKIYSDWSGLMNFSNAEFSTRIVLGIFSIILLAGYFNLSSKRVMKYIGK